MKKLLMVATLAVSIAGCSSWHGITMGPGADKIYVEKNTWFLIWGTHQLMRCDVAANKMTNCVEIETP